MSVDSQYPLRYDLGGLEFYLQDTVLYTLSKSRQLKPGSKEQFGILIGTKSAFRDAYWVESVTTPARVDHSSRSSYFMQSPHHQERLDSLFLKSNGEQIYLGTWHTHPESWPIPSYVDKRDWRQCQNRNRGRQLFFILVGTEGIMVFVRRQLSYEPMTIVDQP